MTHSGPKQSSGKSASESHSHYFAGGFGFGCMQCMTASYLSQYPANVQSASGRPYSTTPVPEKRKALVVGINYSQHSDPSLELKYGIDDANNMVEFLRDDLRFAASDIRLMTDQTRTRSRNHPTKENILGAMKELVRDAQPQDSLFFYFSGHGVQIPDLDGDETDGLDECICAVDYGGKMHRNGDTPGLIVDDIMHEIMVKPLPAECHLTGIFDSCHSGTILDLPHIYDSDGVVKEFRHPNRLEVLRQKESKAVVISLGASEDDQKAIGTRSGGALKQAFIDAMRKSNNDLTYKELIQSVCGYMKKNKIQQKPQLSSSHEMDTNLRFIV